MLTESGRAKGFAYLCLAVAIFICASIVQAIGGSNMFTNTFVAPDNVLLGLLVQATWWPGWLATILFGLRGAYMIVTDRDVR